MTRPNSHALTKALGFSSWPEPEPQRGRKAAALALAVYAGHVRDQGTPYLEHPVAVVAILHNELGVTSPDTLILGLLHDALEVSPTAEVLIAAVLGRDVVRQLRAMTPEHRLEQRPKRPGDDAVWRAKTAALGPEELLVRVADRIHNLRDLARSPARERRTRFVAALVETYLPLAEASRSLSTQLSAACDLLGEEFRRYQQSEMGTTT